MKTFVTFLFIWLLSFLTTLDAQTDYIGLRISKNNLGLPFGNFFQPTIGIGAEAEWRHRLPNKPRTFLNPWIGYYFKDQDSGVYTGLALAHEYGANKFKFGFSYGLGYLHSFNLNPVYSIEDDPDTPPRRHAGVPTVLIRLGIHVHYRLSESIALSVAFFEGLQIPYTKLVGGTTRSSAQLGVLYELKNN